MFVPGFIVFIAESPWFDVINDRYETFLAQGRRKIFCRTGEQVYLVVSDEYASCSATVGDKKQQAEFAPSSLHTLAPGRSDSPVHFPV